MLIEYLYRVHCEHNTFEYLLSILKYKTKYKFNTEKCYLMIPGGVHVILIKLFFALITCVLV